MESKPLLCDVDAVLTEALPNIRASSALILDCEGVNLGERGGSLSLINLKTTHPSLSRTYLIDVVRLSSAALQPIFDLLRSSSVLKVVFDGRMDFSALYHDYGVELQGVLDLQLVDVASRRVRGGGEDQDKQLHRLGGYLHRGEINGNKSLYVDVHKLSGLAECVREHGATGSEELSKGKVNHTSWLLRPLPEAYVAYASADASLIHCLFNKFTELGYITSTLQSQSYTYVSMWKGNQPSSNGTRTGHPLLPLGILDHTSTYDLSKPCTVCSLSLPRTAFSKRSWDSPNDRKCWVCRALSVKSNRESQWNDDDDYWSED